MHLTILLVLFIIKLVNFEILTTLRNLQVLKTKFQRPGSFAIYLEPWHADIFDFLDLRKNTGKEEARARDLFYALWIPDLFMKRVNSLKILLWNHIYLPVF